MKKQKPVPGSIFKIEIEDNRYAYGQILNFGDYAFFDYKGDGEDLNQIINSPIMFRRLVNIGGVEMGRWPIIGHLPIEREELQHTKYWLPEIGKPGFCKIIIDGKWYYDEPMEKAEGLFEGGIAAPENIEQRIRDFYSGVENKDDMIFKEFLKKFHSK